MAAAAVTAMSSMDRQHLQWFGRKPGPNDAIAEYASAPIGGMTNPPRNPVVRKLLLKKLIENGIAPEPARPRPPAPVFKKVYDDDSNAEPSMMLQSRMPKRVKDMTAEERDDILWQNESFGSQEAYSPAGQAPPTIPAASAPRRGRKQVVIDEVPEIVHKAPKATPKKTEEDEEDDDVSPRRTLIKLLRRENERLSQLPPTGLRPVNLFPDLRANDAAKKKKDERGKDEDPRGNDAGKKKKKEEKGKDEPVIRRVKSDSEIRNDMMALRTQGRLHRALFADLNKFPSDITNSEGMLTGAAAVGLPPSVWAADSTHLAGCHNRCLRAVLPSTLELVSEPEKRRPTRRKGEDMEEDKKQEKLAKFDKAKAKDVAHLPVYKEDRSLIEIRKVRRRLMPVEIVRKTSGDLRAEKAMSLMEHVGGGKLLPFRGNRSSAFDAFSSTQDAETASDKKAPEADAGAGGGAGGGEEADS